MEKDDTLTTITVLNFTPQPLFSVAFILFFLATLPALRAQPCPTITTSTNVTVCSGSPQSIVLSNDITTALFSWTVEQVGVLGAADGTGSGIACTLTTTDAAIGSAVYTITPLAKVCKANPVIMTIRVIPTPIVIATPLSSEITSGTAPSIALTSDAIGTAFSWTVIQSGVTGARAGTGSVIKQTLITGDQAGIATYRITPNINGCAGEPINAKVIVKKQR